MSNDRPKLLGNKPMIPDVCSGPGEPGLVSVLIPSYNRAYILGKAIESVLAQDYPLIEIVIVDDGSTDNTKELVNKYPKTRYIYQKNAGIAAARNTGLQAARGEYIAFLDSDDTWYSWKLSAQVAVMHSFPDIVLSWTDMSAVTPSGEVVSEHFISTMYDAYKKIKIEQYLSSIGTLGDVLPNCPAHLNKITFRYGAFFTPMFMGNLVHPPAALMRREAVNRSGGLDLAYSWTIEDYEFFWRLSRYGQGAFIEAPGMSYRTAAADNLSRPSLHLYPAHAFLIALKRCIEQERNRIELPRSIINRQLAYAYTWVGEEELLSDQGSQGSAAIHLFKGLLMNPLQKRALFLFPFTLMPRGLSKLARSIKQKIHKSISSN